MSASKSIFNLFVGGSIFTIFFLLGVALKLLSFVILGFIIYFFFAAGGIVPPLDFIPFIPYV